MSSTRGLSLRPQFPFVAYFPHGGTRELAAHEVIRIFLRVERLFRPPQGIHPPATGERDGAGVKLAGIAGTVRIQNVAIGFLDGGHRDGGERERERESSIAS